MKIHQYVGLVGLLVAIVAAIFMACQWLGIAGGLFVTGLATLWVCIQLDQ